MTMLSTEIVCKESKIEGRRRLEISNSSNETIMGVFFFYKNRKPRKFNYTPILYDPEEEARKERLEKRIEEIKREMGVLPAEEEAKREFKPEFVSQTRHLKKRKARQEAGQNTFYTNNWLLIVIVAVLIGVFIFWILN